MGTISKTYSVDEELYVKFNEICEIKKIKKSEILQDAITKFIVDNFDDDDSVKYRMIHNEYSAAIHIVKKDGEFLTLSNENKLNIFDFEQIYKPVDVDVEQVLEHLTKSKPNTKIVFDETPVEDDFFKKPFIDPNIAEDLLKGKGIFNNTKELKIKDTWNENNIYNKDKRIRESDTFIVDNRTMEEKSENLLENWRINNKDTINKISGSTVLKNESFSWSPIDDINKRISELKINQSEKITFSSNHEKIKHLYSTLELLLSDIVENYKMLIINEGDNFRFLMPQDLICDDIKLFIHKQYEIKSENITLERLDWIDRLKSEEKNTKPLI